ncbi:MAG: hypothetical protein KME33_32100 [Aetokthonos hydrillicola CCALA 1050]|nr:hypothetical protein [Aetokthonos hydrillicola CCALA 1050]
MVSLDEIKVFVLNLPLEQKEQLVSELVDSLPVESKSRTIGSKWTTGGYNFPVNTHLCVQIQNAPNIDIAAIIEAAVMRIRSDREQ